MMPLFDTPRMGASGSTGAYTIDQSIRFNDNDSAYLARTPGTAGNRKTWTFSCWVKRASLFNGSAAQVILSAGDGGANDVVMQFGQSDDTLRISDYESGTASNLIPTQLFRDVGAWYHFVLAYDTTQGTAANRIKLYVNGSQVTAFGTEIYPSLNNDLPINSTIPHNIGRGAYSANGYFDGYLAEINFIDGTAAAPTAFGEFNDDGVWIPKTYSGAYGDQGYYITGATAAALGTDFSGNSNTYTSSGLATTDQMLDTPTTNYPTFSPVFDYSTSGTVAYYRPNYAVSTLSDGNLNLDYNTPNTSMHYCTMAFPTSGKFYWEVTATVKGGVVIGIGGSGNVEDGIGTTSSTAMANVIGYYHDGKLYDELATTATYGNATALANTEYVGVAYDVDNDAIWFCDNGTWVDGNGTDSSATVLTEIEAGTTTSAASTGFTANHNHWFPCTAAVGDYPTVVANFGQSSFTGAAPSGFTDLNSNTLPTPAIADGTAHFQTTLYTGSTSAFDVTFGGNSDLAPDFLWFKARSAASNNFLFDIARGVLKKIESDRTAAEVTSTGSMTAFGTNGFSLGDGGTANDINGVAGTTYAAWSWKANGAGVSNTDGSVTSTVSANTTAGFSVVKYTPGTGAQTWGHGLGVAPKMVIVKEIGQAVNWQVYHESSGAGGKLFLNTTAAYAADTGIWNNTAPTSSVVSTGSGINTANPFIAYCFAEVPGYSSMGTYTGNGALDGPMVNVGFKPAFVMIKVTSHAPTGWAIIDNKRSNPFNPTDGLLQPDQSGAEGTTDKFDILSNGFKVRTTWAGANGSGYTVRYMAFAEHPFKTSTAR